jgi:hypothetical protein
MHGMVGSFPRLILLIIVSMRCFVLMKTLKNDEIKKKNSSLAGFGEPTQPGPKNTRNITVRIVVNCMQIFRQI